MVQRGTTHHPAAGAPAESPTGAGATADPPAAPKNSPRSNTIVLDIDWTPFNGRSDEPRLWETGFSDWHRNSALRPTSGRQRRVRPENATRAKRGRPNSL